MPAPRAYASDYPALAMERRARVRDGAAGVAAAAGFETERIAKSYIRKEAVVAEVLGRHGAHLGLVHVISAIGTQRLQAVARQDVPATR